MVDQIYHNAKQITLACLLGFVLVVGIFSMPREEYIADPLAMRCETVNLINNASLAVPAAFACSFGERGQFFVENVTTRKWYCKYGILNSLLYLPILAVQKYHEGKLKYLSSTRVIYLNWFNLLLTLATACYLFLIASRYTLHSTIALLFVLAAFYATYWWNYLRAQNSEIYQTLFMLGFYYHLVRASDGDNIKRQEVLAGLFFAALILTKIVYLILCPVIGIFFISINYQFSGKSISFLERLRYFLQPIVSFGIPVMFSLGVILWVNNYKFGSPFESGYGQWQESGKPIFSGSFFSGLAHFFFDPQYSIFIYFPLLTFALFGYGSFFKNFRKETFLLLGIGITLLLVNSKLLAWSGGWGYGPRYLLVMLPLVSLPFLEVLEWIWEKRKSFRGLLVGGLIALVLMTSLKLQMNVNALSFFVSFRLQKMLASFHDPEIEHYFSTRPFGIINRDLLDFKEGEPLSVLASVENKLSPEKKEQLHQFIRSQLTSNYYWFSDAH